MYYLLIYSLLCIVFYIISAVLQPITFEWIDYDFTDAVKGAAIIMVMWSHLGAACGIQSIQFVAGAGVSLFLICSGYGLEKSFTQNTLSNYWKKKIFRVAIPFWIILFLKFVFLRNVTGFALFKELFVFSSSDWYLKYLLRCYLYFWLIKKISFKFSLSIKQEWILIIAIWIFRFVGESFWPSVENTPFLEARQFFSFPAGIWLAQNEQKIEMYLRKNKSHFMIFALLGCAFACICNYMLHTNMPILTYRILFNVISMLVVFPLAIIVLMASVYCIKVFRNKFLCFMGSMSYELYLIHTMLFFRNYTSWKMLLVVVFETMLFSLFLHLSMKLLKKKFYNCLIK